jgi:integrase
MLITQHLARSAPPKLKPYEIRDERLKGFILRVQPTGVKTYIVEYTRGHRITIGRANVLTLTQARNEAIRVLADWSTGVDPRRKRSAALGTFIDDHYAPWAAKNQKTTTKTAHRVRYAFPELLDLPINDVVPFVVEKIKNKKLAAGLQPSTINRDVAALKSVISKALGWGVIEANPLARFAMMKTDSRAVVRYLSSDEEKRLYAVLDGRNDGDRIKPTVTVSLHTGLRRGELFSLRWIDIDFDKKALTVHGATAKSRQSRYIPLNKIALSSLLEWREYQSKHLLVFPSKDGKRLQHVNRAWSIVLREADIHSFRWHDQRHHFASKLVMAGVDLNTVRELLGHSDIKMTLRYAHLAPEHKAAAVELIA